MPFSVPFCLCLFCLPVVRRAVALLITSGGGGPHYRVISTYAHTVISSPAWFRQASHRAGPGLFVSPLRFSISQCLHRVYFSRNVLQPFSISDVAESLTCITSYLAHARSRTCICLLPPDRVSTPTFEIRLVVIRTDLWFRDGFNWHEKVYVMVTGCWRFKFLATLRVGDVDGS